MFSSAIAQNSVDQQQFTGDEPFLSTYGPTPVVVLTEKLSGQNNYLASVSSPSQLGWHGSGRTWQDAHWDLFKVIVQEFGFLNRNRNRLGPNRLRDLVHLEYLAQDGTLEVLARIVAEGYDSQQTSMIDDHLPSVR
jgi:hypothetical protein